MTGGAGALGAIAATAVLRPTPSDASTGAAVFCGTQNSANKGDPTTLEVDSVGSATLYPWGFGVVNYSGTSPVAGAVGVSGTTAFGALTNDHPTAIGVKGQANNGTGVMGVSTNGAGLQAQSSAADGTFSTTAGSARAGVYGQNTGGNGWGVVGRTNSSANAGVWGDNTAGGTGVVGGTTGGGVGVHGQSQTGDGVQGLTAGTGASAVFGNNTSGGALSKGVFGAASGSGTGVLGSSASGAGVTGTSSSGDGVTGSSTSGDGVYGFSTGATKSGVYGAHTGFNGYGVVGRTNGQTAAVWGDNTANGTGVMGGTTGGGVGVYGQSQTGNGVYGSTSSSSASGVYGHNAGSGYGVAGRAESGTGILGDSANGIGVVANSANGTALSVSGKALFNRSGLVAINYPARSATVTVPGGLSAAALVLAVMQNSVSGIYVVSAVPNTSTGNVTINLNQAPATAPKTAKVAWFVVN